MERKRKILLDTNAIIYFLEGAAEFEVIGDFKTFYYSFITEIELLSYRDEERKQKILAFLKNGKLITINHKLISQTIEIRNKYRLKIPDAIIVASAQSIKADLYTSDEEIVKKIDFVKIHNLLKR